MEFERFSYRNGQGLRIIFEDNEEYNAFIETFEYLNTEIKTDYNHFDKLINDFKRLYKEENGIITTVIFDDMYKNIFYCLMDLKEHYINEKIELLNKQNKIMEKLNNKIEEQNNILEEEVRHKKEYLLLLEGFVKLCKNHPELKDEARKIYE